MYWLFLIIFIVAILIPDIIRSPFYFLTEERAEEVAIFLMGVVAFAVFIKNEHRMHMQKKEKERDQKKMNQAVKDLVESYSYIGEVNRKMDILMNIALGLSDRSILDKKRENEIYLSIANAANFLIKGENAFLRFVNTKTGKTIKEIVQEKQTVPVGNKELLSMVKGDMNVKKCGRCIAVSSLRTISDVKSYLIICGFDEEEEKNPKNMEILKVFSSQALFLYSYSALENGDSKQKDKK